MLSLRIVGAAGSSASRIPASVHRRSMSSRMLSGLTLRTATLLRMAGAYAITLTCQGDGRSVTGMAEKKPLLLIADDDPEILTMLSLRFSKKGYEVIEASDGDATVRHARERRPDVLILDVMMPGKTGWEVARELRADDHLQ